jgi:hypothetical protein
LKFSATLLHIIHEEALGDAWLSFNPLALTGHPLLFVVANLIKLFSA